MNPLPDDPPPASALFADRRPQIRTASLEELDKIVENSSEKNRNFFIAYLGLLVYVQAIIFSTTDLQLLTGTALKLPIVDLDVPLVGFYVVVPLFVIALHFNFLQNLESHHYKLMRWQDAHPGGVVPRSRIQPFLFDYAMLETGSQMERMVRWANNLLVLNLAPITLGLLLWRYTDRQEAAVTVWHYLAFLFDSCLVWKLRVALRRNRHPESAEPTVHGWPNWLSPVVTQGAVLFETNLSGAVAPPNSPVFGTPAFNIEPINWVGLEALAVAVPSKVRQEYLESIKGARTRPAGEAEARLRNDPDAIYRDVLPALCGAPDRKGKPESHLAAIRGIRRNYRDLKTCKENKKLLDCQSTLTAVDRALCTLPACADLKDDIEGLDCRPFATSNPEVHSKR